MLVTRVNSVVTGCSPVTGLAFGLAEREVINGFLLDWGDRFCQKWDVKLK
jgi:hypothetical protein